MYRSLAAPTLFAISLLLLASGASAAPARKLVGAVTTEPAAANASLPIPMPATGAILAGLKEASSDVARRMIVVLASRGALETAKAMCAASHPDPDCHVAAGSCQHFFETALFGVAGHFSSSQLRRCLRNDTHDGIRYMEPDGTVNKAERSNYGKWWLLTPRQRRQQRADVLTQAAMAAPPSPVDDNVEAFDEDAEEADEEEFMAVPRIHIAGTE